MMHMSSQHHHHRATFSEKANPPSTTTIPPLSENATASRVQLLFPPAGKDVWDEGRTTAHLAPPTVHRHSLRTKKCCRACAGTDGRRKEARVKVLDSDLGMVSAREKVERAIGPLGGKRYSVGGGGGRYGRSILQTQISISKKTRVDKPMMPMTLKTRGPNIARPVEPSTGRTVSGDGGEG